MLDLDPELPFLEINAEQRQTQEYLLHHFFKLGNSPPDNQEITNQHAYKISYSTAI